MADSVQVELIPDETEYGGMRVRLFGDLAGTRASIQADIGFRNVVTAGPREIEYPTLLGPVNTWQLAALPAQKAP